MNPEQQEEYERSMKLLDKLSKDNLAWAQKAQSQEEKEDEQQG